MIEVLDERPAIPLAERPLIHMHTALLAALGEQQMLVLAYQLLFETTPGTLLLIDEPEISLHVAWQNRFVEDITEMGRGRDIQFLLATHSPTLIGGRENIRRPLDVGTRP